MHICFLQPWHTNKKMNLCFGNHKTSCIIIISCIIKQADLPCEHVCVFTDIKHTDLPLVYETRVVFVDRTASTDTWGHRFHPDSYLGQAYDILNTKTRLINNTCVANRQYTWVWCMWSTSLHLVSGLLVTHVMRYGIRCDSSGEGLPQQHSETPHVTLGGVSPWWTSRGSVETNPSVRTQDSGLNNAGQVRTHAASRIWLAGLSSTDRGVMHFRFLRGNRGWAGGGVNTLVG